MHISPQLENSPVSSLGIHSLLGDSICQQPLQAFDTNGYVNVSRDTCDEKPRMGANTRGGPQGE